MTRYTRIAMLLHWAIALLILTNLALGLRLEGLKGGQQFAAFQLHKSIGITVLLLSLARIGWRLAHRPPPFSERLSALERLAASITHSLFYALMLLLPLTGWVLVSASRYNIPTLLYGIIPWPHIGAIRGASAEYRTSIESAATATHETLAYTMIALVALHVAGALKHQFYDRDGTMLRMLPEKVEETNHG